MDYGSATVWTAGKRDLIEVALGKAGEEVGLTWSDDVWDRFCDAAIRNLTKAPLRSRRLPAKARTGHG
jgi:hypothetical protein